MSASYTISRNILRHRSIQTYHLRRTIVFEFDLPIAVEERRSILQRFRFGLLQRVACRTVGVRATVFPEIIIETDRSAAVAVPSAVLNAIAVGGTPRQRRTPVLHSLRAREDIRYTTG